ncbi:MAG TPA: 16S rRNA (cytosine(1402)-N(4))-methyltransferase RsmH [Blastocatellia bacterium]
MADRPENTDFSEGQVAYEHRPVLLAEVLRTLEPERGGTFVDCTLGLGGHSEAFLSAAPDVEVIGMDADSESIEMASRRLERFGSQFRAVHSNFKELERVLDELGIEKVRGILADLGISSYQLGLPERGFSFQQEAPLDMRMDRNQPKTAASLVNNLDESELADIIYQYGEEKGSRRIARLIVKERANHPIETTSQLASIVVRAVRVKGHWRIHPATRTFQALRIAVNEELEGLPEFISTAISRLEPHGKLGIISFHSLEDRIVKTAFRRESGVCQCRYPHFGGDEDRHAPAEELDEEELDEADAHSRTVERDAFKASTVVCQRCGAVKRVSLLTRKPIRPGEEEIGSNPRSRSARLRVCERLG